MGLVRAPRQECRNLKNENAEINLLKCQNKSVWVPIPDEVLG